jgi:hypothetical protein
MSNFIQTPSGNERILPESSHPLKGGSTRRNTSGAKWRASCTIRDATAIARQSVCWPLKKHANLITANFASLWPSHGFRWLVKMRQ